MQKKIWLNKYFYFTKYTNKKNISSKQKRETKSSLIDKDTV